MIFSSCSIICFCGVYFVRERAEVNFFVIELNSGFPFSLSFVPFKAFVFREGFCFSLGAVAEILGHGCGTEVCLSIVEAVVVFVVADHVFWDMNNFAVHPYSLSGVFGFLALPADGV